MKGLDYIKLCVFCLMALCLAGCDEDEWIYEDLTRYAWVGDLGFVDRYGEPLESGLYLEGNGFGSDEQCYANGWVYTTLTVRWWLRDGVLALDYGNDYPLLEIVDVRIFGDELSGELYVDGRPDGYVVLYRY